MEYLLPIKAAPADDLTELAGYVHQLSRQLPVLVVDSSAPETFARNAALFMSARHVAVDPSLACANGKVAGVLTGFALASSDRIVIADDDVRYEPAELDRLAELLDHAEVVVPQDYYSPMSGPAWWDTGRILINRLLPSGDFPGTLAVRLTPRLRRLGYAGDVLFENLELVRTVVADGGRALVARDLFVRRLPPTGHQFLDQRIRQAYDSQAQPMRLGVELSVLPLAVLALRRPRRIAAAAAGCVVLAEAGRRRAQGGGHFPAYSSLAAPLWVAERAGCAWIALWRRCTGRGATYGGNRISRAANSVAALRRRRATSYGSRRTAA